MLDLENAYILFLLKKIKKEIEMKNILLLMLLVAFLAPFREVVQASANNSQSIRAMWVWDYYASVSNEKQRNELIQFSTLHQINMLFVYTGEELSAYPDAFNNLIRLAHSKGIRIFALEGDSLWAREENHSIAIGRIEGILKYNNEHPDSSFDGIQLDVEPYLLPDFFDQVQNIGTQYLTLLQKSRDLIHKQSMVFDAAIPFWYEDPEPTVSVTFNGQEKPLSFHILDVADSVSIMAYRDSSEEQIRISQQEITYAGKIGKKAYVGAETNPPDGVSIPEFITYYDEGIRFMEIELRRIERYYKDMPGYGGIGIHWYGSFKKMAKAAI
ncbi:hypothetical protein ACFQ88_06100 [Paenibacillus sp. NPDC056579]|uniref:hypothetical protein n=1 Tax=Paenibacillus sp. NPDC056579 TaxID=3345871 RepID=UPI003697EEF2